jgi:hypothetical protein
VRERVICWHRRSKGSSEVESKNTCAFLCHYDTDQCERGSFELHHQTGYVHVLTPDGPACMSYEWLVSLPREDFDRLIRLMIDNRFGCAVAKLRSIRANEMIRLP